jgi:amino acid transporter
MKSILKKISLLLVFIAFAAIEVKNPAPGLFSEAFGTDAKTIITGVITVLLGFAGLISMAYIILGGYQIATSGGNEDSVKNGRKTLTNAIIGLLVIIFSYIIVSVVINAAFNKARVPGGNTPSPTPAPIQPSDDISA